MDSDDLEEYAELDPSVDTLDEFTEKLVRSNVIRRNVSDRCEVHVSTTTSRNLEIVLSARNNSLARFCHEQGQELANRINGTGGMAQDLPPELGFAAAATSAPLVLDDITSVTPTAGAPQFVPSLFLLLAPMLLISLF